jgi:alpha-D-ribose 1-methylphosphonate 5-triphosphate synthase subunit PhnH
VEITCYRDREVKQELHQLPAATYNLAHTLLARSANGNLFIPIRAMQYLAILDAEELVFLDGQRKCWIEIAWRKFHTQARSSLDEPVAYEAVYYTEIAEKLMSRLQAELPRALRELAKKSTVDGPAKVLKFPAPGKS